MIVCCPLLLLHSAELHMANLKQWRKHIMRWIDEIFPVLLLYFPHIMLFYIFFSLMRNFLFFRCIFLTSCYFIFASPFYFSNTDQIFVIFKNEEDWDDDDLLSVSDQLNGVIFSIILFFFWGGWIFNIFSSSSLNIWSVTYSFNFLKYS